MVFFILSHRQIIGNSAYFSRSSRSTRLHFIHHFQNHVFGFSEVASDAKKKKKQIFPRTILGLFYISVLAARLFRNLLINERLL